ALPTYAFQRERYWLDGGQRTGGHPLLGAAVDLPDGGLLATGRLSLGDQPWLGEHRVWDTAIVPGTVFVEVALWAAGRVGLGAVGGRDGAPLRVERGVAARHRGDAAAGAGAGRRGGAGRRRGRAGGLGGAPARAPGGVSAGDAGRRCALPGGLGRPRRDGRAGA